LNACKGHKQYINPEIRWVRGYPHTPGGSVNHLGCVTRGPILPHSPRLGGVSGAGASEKCLALSTQGLNGQAEL